MLVDFLLTVSWSNTVIKKHETDIKIVYLQKAKRDTETCLAVPKPRRPKGLPCNCLMRERSLCPLFSELDDVVRHNNLLSLPLGLGTCLWEILKFNVNHRVHSFLRKIMAWTR